MVKGQIIYAMCEKWKEGFTYMQSEEKEYIYAKMEQIFNEVIAPNMDIKEES